MKFSVIIIMIILLSTQCTFASSPPKPNNCPSADILKAVGVNTVVYDGYNWYAGIKSNHYATNQEWSFLIEPINAVNKDDAKYKAINILNALTFQKGPELSKQNEKYSWVCLYKDNLGHSAGTITPTINFTNKNDMIAPL